MTKVKLLGIYTRIEPDNDADSSYLLQKGFENRWRQYNNGVFEFVGVRALAEILDNDTIKRVETPGVWSIESDNQESIDIHTKDELDELKDTLIKDYGFTKRKIESMDIMEFDS